MILGLGCSSGDLIFDTAQDAMGTVLRNHSFQMLEVGRVRAVFRAAQYSRRTLLNQFFDGLSVRTIWIDPGLLDRT